MTFLPSRRPSLHQAFSSCTSGQRPSHVCPCPHPSSTQDLVRTVRSWLTALPRHRSAIRVALCRLRIASSCWREQVCQPALLRARQTMTPVILLRGLLLALGPPGLWAAAMAWQSTPRFPWHCPLVQLAGLQQQSIAPQQVSRGPGHGLPVVIPAMVQLNRVLPKQGQALLTNLSCSAGCSEKAELLSPCAWACFCSFKKILTLFHAAF